MPSNLVRVCVCGGGSIRIPGYRVGHPKECGGVYVSNPRKGIDWKTERNKGQVVYFVKP